MYAFFCKKKHHSQGRYLVWYYSRIGIGSRGDSIMNETSIVTASFAPFTEALDKRAELISILNQQLLRANTDSEKAHDDISEKFSMIVSMAEDHSANASKAIDSLTGSGEQNFIALHPHLKIWHMQNQKLRTA